MMLSAGIFGVIDPALATGVLVTGYQWRLPQMASLSTTV
jgi:hypothetical protein